MSKTVAIIGAGIVGVSTAIWLQREGHKVILIDKAGPAEGTSFGNGGVLASCALVPVTGPGLVTKAPRMALDPNQPLFLKWGHLPRLAPWLLKYLSYANAKDTRRIAAAIAGVTLGSVEEHQQLASGTGAERWIKPSNYYYIYNNRKAFEKDAFGWGLRRDHGVAWKELEGDAFHQECPAFAKHLGFGVKMGDHGRITDPGQYVKDLASHVKAQGGDLIIGDVTDIAVDNGAVTGLRVSGETIACDSAVIATGVWSGPLAKRLGLKVPLAAESGYHVELWNPSITPDTPVMIAGDKFVMTPMEGRLRFAGVVEFGPMDREPSRAPIEMLKRNGLAALPGIKFDEITEWMGHRPATADSIPVIGEIPGVAGAFTGFGHQHIGLTAGPKTGRLLAQLISGRKPNLDLTAYSPARFTT